MKKKCPCLNNITEEIEKKFKPVVVYKIQFMCPKCGISGEAVKNTPEGVGFKKWVDMELKEWREANVESRNNNKKSPK